MVLGTRTVTTWMSLEAFHKTLGPKEIHRVEDASHVDLYDRSRYVDPVIEKLTSYFTTHLTGFM